MVSRWGWLLRLLTRRLWFRAALIAMLALASPMVAAAIGPLIPADLPAKVGADAVETILEILASSMLAVTTFSLTTMVSAYAAATTSVTPRATKLLIEDSTSQNVLATFLGSFLFSLVSIISLAMNVYGERGRLVLFAFTIIVVLLIVTTLLRWIDYVIRLGRVNETTEVVEQATRSALETWVAAPGLGGVPVEPSTPPDESWVPLASQTIGYVRHVDVARLDKWARAHDARVRVMSVPGTFVDRHRALALSSVPIPQDEAGDLRAAFAVCSERTYDQDPRFGFAVLAEISSRALSPAVNDPGTAIDVIGRATRLLDEWCAAERSPEVRFDRVLVPALDTGSLFDAVFVPIARDGAALVEVQVRLQKAMEALARIEGRDCREEALQHSRSALERAGKSMQSTEDLKRVKEAAAHVGKR